MQDELLEIVNDRGEVISTARRSEIHGNPALLHRVVHVLLFNERGELLLQKRSIRKDVAPGRWDTSVGGHVEPGEALEEAARRELGEELGINTELRFLYSYKHSNPYETELVYTFLCRHASGAGFSFNREEIDEVRFWSIGEILGAIEGKELSENFKDEIRAYLRHSESPLYTDRGD